MLSHMDSEANLISILNGQDELVWQCAAGHLSFSEFCVRYDNFYWAHALDGHESDSVEAALLAKYADRIAPHRAIAGILGKVCSEVDAEKESYILAARIGSAEAIARIKLVAAGIPT
ncbi:MAG: hypothetical protein ACRERC_19115 [Candidatus Binatia bacterium]